MKRHLPELFQKKLNAFFTDDDPPPAVLWLSVSILVGYFLIKVFQ
ncbi:hypothetical protein BIZ83_gp112 [Erwinia phage vB_EamM_ChrisDB]|nr:hypothetical protein BIZ83_gp112 [Erwinia phage vB_EamM_ChrisDB]ANZ48741.1 hypothetical protein CHRISDB_179 [Erwinia phage vB_EamM_ChrisDB]